MSADDRNVHVIQLRLNGIAALKEALRLAEAGELHNVAFVGIKKNGQLFIHCDAGIGDMLQIRGALSVLAAVVDKSMTGG
jgi:hypothetical protein